MAQSSPARKGPPRRPAVRMLTPAQVAKAVAMMATPSGTARFAKGKALSLTAEKDPGRVYPHFDALVALLGSHSKIVRWIALQIIASLAAVDTERKLDGCLDAYLASIRGDSLVSAANAIHGAGRIARARSDLLDRLIPAILEVEHANYATPECRNVAIGQTLETLRQIGPSACQQPAVASFIRRQRTNSRAAVARLAERMILTLNAGA